jgi:hypothetical protein
MDDDVLILDLLILADIICALIYQSLSGDFLMTKPTYFIEFSTDSLW